MTARGEAIRARLVGELPIRWRVSSGDPAGIAIVAEWRDDTIILTEVSNLSLPIAIRRAIADFVAHAPEDIAWLLDRVRALEAGLAEITAHGCERSLHGCATGDAPCRPCIARATLAGE